MYEEETKKSNSDRIDYDDIVGAEGTIDIKAYAKRIKQNIADQSGISLKHSHILLLLFQY